MKKLIILLMLLPACLQATVISHWVGNSLVDDKGNYDLSNQNAVGVSQSAGGKYAFGNFNAVNGRLYTSSVSQGIKSYETYFYVSTIKDNTYMINYSAAFDWIMFSQIIVTKQNIMIYVGGFQSVYQASANEWHLFSTTRDGTNIRAYVDNTLLYTSGNGTYNAVANTVWNFGNYVSLGGAFNGYMADIQIADSVYTNFPMTDVVNTATPTSTATPTATYTPTKTNTPSPTFTITPTVTQTPVPYTAVPMPEISLTLRVKAVTNDHTVFMIHNEKWTSQYVINVDGIEYAIQFPYDPKKVWWYYIVPVATFQKAYLKSKYNGKPIQSVTIKNI